MKTEIKNFTIIFSSVFFLTFAGCGKQNSQSELEVQKVNTTEKHADSSKPLIVTAGNFNRAETDMYFAATVKMAGGIGRFFHRSEIVPIENQTVIRANRDVLYSSGVFDLDAGNVTITLPDPGKRFMSLIVIDEDQYSKTEYAPGTFTYSKDKIGTRYVLLGIRIFIDPADKKDLERVKDLQESIKIDQKDKGSFVVPVWDKESQKRIHDSLIQVSKTIPDTKRMFGLKAEVDPLRHLVGTASGWGGNAEKDAMYVTVTPTKNDGKTFYKLKIKDVPVDGFWSVSVYNKEGYFEKNNQDVYTLNNVTAKKDKDGAITIQFGGCDGKTPNCIPIMPGWNYWVRLYRPRQEILENKWKFPNLEQIN